MIFIADLLNPKNDYVFRRIFGYVGNEDITKSLLEAIIPEKINKIELDCNPITEKDLLNDKVGILDIKAKLNNNVNCNIEMQIADKNNIEKRMLFYWSKMYTQSIKSGDEYETLERTIVILMSDYNLDNLANLPEYLTKWNIREENHSKMILTDVLELYIIELEKAKKYLGNKSKILEAWIEFINNPKKELSLMENEKIKKAKKILEEISQDERERRLTELREKYIRDQNATRNRGYDLGLKDGIEQGIEQGRQQGIEQNKLEIVKKMKLEKFDTITISRITGLTEDEINNL